jgi:hypothetical protein
LYKSANYSWDDFKKYLDEEYRSDRVDVKKWVIA